jgi:hypothetical protein
MTEPLHIQCCVFVDRPFWDVRAALHRLAQRTGGALPLTSVSDVDGVAGLPAATRVTVCEGAGPFGSMELCARSSSAGTKLEVDGHWWPARKEPSALRENAVEAFLDAVVAHIRDEVDAERARTSPGARQSGVSAMCAPPAGGQSTQGVRKSSGRAGR